MIKLNYVGAVARALRHNYIVEKPKEFIKIYKKPSKSPQGLREEKCVKIEINNSFFKRNISMSQSPNHKANKTKTIQTKIPYLEKEVIYNRYRDNYNRYITTLSNASKHNDKKINGSNNEFNLNTNTQNKQEQLNLNNISEIQSSDKNNISKTEENMIYMRILKYNSQIEEMKEKKEITKHVRLIQKKWRYFYKVIYLQKVIKIQCYYRGYLNLKKANLIRKENLKNEFGCQTEMEMPEEEAAKVVYMNIYGGGKLGLLTGIKTFPRLKIEIGNNSSLIRKYKLHRIGNDYMEIETQNNLSINISYLYDEIRSDITKLNIIPLNAKNDNSSNRSTLRNTLRRTIRRNSLNSGNGAVQIIRKKVPFEVFYFYSKVIKKKKQMNKVTELACNTKLYIFVMLLVNFICKSIHKNIFDLMRKKYFFPFNQHKINFSILSINEEISDNDKSNIDKLLIQNVVITK